MFDPITGEGRCHGKFVLETHDRGTWPGTFAGSMTFPTTGNLGTFLYDLRVIGRGTSGDVTGMTFITRDVKSDPYITASAVTGTLIAPHGL